MFKNAIRAMRGQMQNSSDPGAVLEAGWAAMQQADPRLAQAVSQLPPSVAQQAVLQYTNAIRSGKDADASTMAAQHIRTSLAEMAKPQPMRASKAVARMAAGGTGEGAPNPQPQGISSLEAFEAAMAPQPVAATRALPRFRKGPAPAIAQPAAPSQPDVFQKVRDSYNNFNTANQSEYQKNLLWDAGPAPQKDLTVPTGWKPTLPAAPGLIGQFTGGDSGSR